MIQITVTPETAGEMSLIANALCEILSLRDGARRIIVGTAASEAPAVEKVVAEAVPADEQKPRKPRAKKSEVVIEQPAAEEATTPEQPAAEEATVGTVESAPAPEPEKPAVTLEVVRGLAASLSQAGKAALVKQAITDLGASRLTDLNPESFPALYEVLKGL